MVATEGEALGLYISIPFCRSKCAYCNFASGVYPASVQARYVDRLVEDLAAAGAWAERMGVELPRRVDTVYLGGGTPSLLAPEQVTQLFAARPRGFRLGAKSFRYLIDSYLLQHVSIQQLLRTLQVRRRRERARARARTV